MIPLVTAIAVLSVVVGLLLLTASTVVLYTNKVMLGDPVIIDHRLTAGIAVAGAGTSLLGILVLLQAVYCPWAQLLGYAAITTSLGVLFYGWDHDLKRGKDITNTRRITISITVLLVIVILSNILGGSHQRL